MTDEPNTAATGNSAANVTTTSGGNISVPATGTTTVKTEPRSEDGIQNPSEFEKALKKANKEAETLRLKLKEHEDAKKSEEQKLSEAKAAAEKDAAEARLNYLRLKVGTSKGLPAEVADRLRGENEDEMAEDADRLLALLKPGSPNGSADGGTQGKAPEGSADNMNTLLRKAALGQ